MVAASTLSHPSQCKAKALLIALSYENRDGVENLSTTHADQDRLAQHLVDFWGYCPECIIKMRDGSDDVTMRPTRKNIFREIANLVRDVKRGDRRVFYFAGHCYQVVNRRGTENDNLDEVILVDGKDVPTLLCGRSLAEGHLDFSKIERKERRKIHDAIIMDNELRRHLVDRIPVGAKLVAISDTCNSGTLFDLDFHWQDDERCHCRMKTLIRPRIKPWAERWKRRSLDLFRPRKQLPMKRTATDVERREEMIPSMDESSSSRSNRSPPDAQDESDKSNASLFGELPRCSSPPPGELPEIMSLASSHDGETTYSSKDSMTMVFIDIIESLNGPIVTRTLVQELNNKMKQLRCDWMNMYWKTLAETQIVNKNIVDKKLQIIRCIQQPVIGSLSRKAPERIFEL